jgi:hypothetical protein
MSTGWIMQVEVQPDNPPMKKVLARMYASDGWLDVMTLYINGAYS